MRSSPVRGISDSIFLWQYLRYFSSTSLIFHKLYLENKTSLLITFLLLEYQNVSSLLILYMWEMTWQGHKGQTSSQSQSQQLNGHKTEWCTKMTSQRQPHCELMKYTKICLKGIILVPVIYEPNCGIHVIAKMTTEHYICGTINMYFRLPWVLKVQISPDSIQRSLFR